jgi:hypothetical protein
MSTVTFRDFADAALWAAGARVQVAASDPAFVIVTLTGATHTSIVSRSRQDAYAQAVDPANQSSRGFHLGVAGTTKIVRDDGSGIVARLQADGSVVFQVVYGNEHGPIQPPVAAWCVACPDEWLATAALECAQSGDSWSGVVAAGMIARLVELDDPATARRVLTALAAGTPDPLLSTIRAPRLWVRALSLEQVQVIEDLAVVNVEHVADRFDTIAEEARHATPANVLHLYHERDDIESVRTLLLEVGRAGDVDALLRGLDERAGAWVASNRRARIAVDEHLRRVASGNEWVWWSGDTTGGVA